MTYEKPRINRVRGLKGILQNLEKSSLLIDMINSILQNMLDGLIVINEYGCIKYLNPVAEDILGKSTQEIKGEYISNVCKIQEHCIKCILNEGKPYSDVEETIDTSRGRIHLLTSGVPFKDKKEVVKGGVICLRSVKKAQRLVNHLSRSYAKFHFKDIITRNAKMREIIQIASQAASNMSNVLLEGESGTGKELFAQAIHNQSSRQREPFIALNCGAIPRELVNSELFGYVEGAFTGTKRGGNPGKFELASGGTLFFDEIGDMLFEQQAALLRVLEEKTITRIGGNKVIPIDVRIICATNKNLYKEVEKGNFREDLYYRLNVITIHIPPLRERHDDIPLLLKHFLEKFKGIEGIILNEHVEPEMLKYFQHYDWPGNVRQMQNAVERMLISADGSKLCMKHLPEEITSFRSGKLWADLSSSSCVKTVNEIRENSRLQRVEREYNEIISLLESYGGNISQVARKLGVDRSTIYRKIRVYNKYLKD